MINLEALKTRLHNQCTSVTIGETEWRIGKISAAELFALHDMAKAPDVDADRSESGIKFYAALLSKTLMNGEGRAFDSDEARSILPNALTWEELRTLGQAAMAWNNLGDDAKKN